MGQNPPSPPSSSYPNVQLYAWEIPLAEKVRLLRGREILLIRIAGILSATTSSVMQVVSALGVWGSLSLYIIAAQGGIVNVQSSVIFTAYALIMAVRTPMQMSNLGQHAWAEAKPSFERLEAQVKQWLRSSLPHLTSAQMMRVLRQSPAIDSDTELLVEVRDASFGYLSDEFSAPTVAQLAGVTLQLKPGQLVAVVGPVAAGKSTLAQALIQDGGCELMQGRLAVRGGVSFAPQTPWIMSATVKDNILFRLPFDKQ